MVLGVTLRQSTGFALALKLNPHTRVVTPMITGSSGDPAAARSSWTPPKVQVSLLGSVAVWEGKGISLDDTIGGHYSSHRNTWTGGCYQ